MEVEISLERVPLGSEEPLGSGLEKLEVVFKQISAHKYSNMVAERRLTAMMLLGVVEVVALTGQEYSPSSMLTLEKVVGNDRKESTEADPVPPCWESSGKHNGDVEV